MPQPIRPGLVALLVLVAASAALAQQRPADPTPAPSSAPAQKPVPDRKDDDTKLPTFAAEITVTAQKKIERAVDVPIAMTVLDSTRIEASGLRQVQDVAKSTPLLHFETVGISRPQVHMRGIGTGLFDAGSDPSVPIFVDEIYVPRFGGMQFDLFDIDRIEVLKGPQGTLFGRNAAGGAISIITKPPSPAPETRVQIGGGNLSAWDVSASTNGTLLPDTLFGRASMAVTRRGGYTTNLTTGDKENDINSAGARGSLLYRGGPSFDVQISADYLRDRWGMWANKSITKSIFLLFPPLASKFTTSPDPYAEAYTTSGHQNRDIAGASSRVEWRHDLVQVTSLTAFRRSSLDELQDGDATRADTFTRGGTETSNGFSQELRVAGGTRDSTLSGLVGLYYFRESSQRTDTFGVGVDDVLARVFNAGRSFNTIWNDRFTTNSVAVFGSGSAQLGARLSVTAGGRFTSDHKDADRTTDNGGVGSPLLPVNYAVSPSDHWTSFDPMVSINVKPATDVLVYGAFREGFKSGGFQYTVAAARAAAATYGPEHVRTYEAGTKYMTPGHTVSVDAALFYNDYRDMQLFAGTGTQGGLAPLFITTNAGQSTAKGVEVQTVVRPVTGLELTLAYGHLDARFDQYLDGNGNNQAGHQLIRSPRNTADLAASYSFILPRTAVLVVRADWSYKDKVYFDPDNTEALAQPAYSLVNARAALMFGNGRWEVAGWGKNLTNEMYYQNVIALSLSTVGLATVAPPRTFGATLTRKW